MNSPYGNNSQPNAFDSSTHLKMAADASTEARMDFVRLTYVLFLAGIVTSIFGGILCLNSPIQNVVIGLFPWSILALLPLSIGAGVLSHSPNKSVSYAALFGFTLIMGLLIAPVVAAYAPAIVQQAAALTVLIFSVLTAYVFITRKDFSFMGGILVVGFVSLIGAGLLNLFLFKNSDFSYWISWGVLMFSAGFVLYDTSNILERYPLDRPAGAALGLFISFYNIFMSLLRILGGRN